MIRKTMKYIKLWLNFRECYTERNCSLPYMHMWIDWILSLLFLGATAQDYFIYRFYEKKWYLRKQFVTEIKSINIIKKYNNNAQDGRWIVEDKSKFDKVFKAYINRDAISSAETTEEEFVSFVKQHEKVIVKPVDGCNGDNIFIIRYQEGEKRLRTVYKKLSKHKYVIEEVLEQDGWLKELNPGTLNTLRVNIINNNDNYIITNAILRSGQGNVVTDNICAGGVVSWVDIESGIITSMFCDLKDKKVLRHPLTGKIIIGNKIPSWELVKKTAIEAAKIISDVKYTSWDIAVIKNNRVAIVEGNTYGNFNIQQVITQQGVYEQYKALM